MLKINKVEYDGFVNWLSAKELNLPIFYQDPNFIGYVGMCCPFAVYFKDIFHEDVRVGRDTIYSKAFHPYYLLPNWVKGLIVEFDKEKPTTPQSVLDTLSLLEISAEDTNLVPI